MDLRSISVLNALQNATKAPCYISGAVIRDQIGNDHVMEFESAISVVSGRNGAGKTTILKSISRALGTTSDEDGPEERAALSLARCTVMGSVADQDWRVEIDYASGASSGECRISAYYLDPAKSALQSLTVMEGDPNFRDLIEGVDSYKFSDDMRDAAAYVIGREYESVAVYEIEEMASGHVPLPFFEVVAGGLTYDSMGMGRGELNVIYLLWFLSYIDRGSVVLIEEPEAHLAQYSQGNLVNALAVIRKDRNLQLIVSSHYPGFFEALPAGSLYSVKKLPHFRLEPIVDVYEYARRLGAVQRVSTAVLVEDVVASAFLRELVQVFDPGLMHKLAIVPVGLGESGIFKFIDSIQDDKRYNLHFMGVLDGDCRGKHSYVKAGLLFLPGNCPPEELVKDVLRAWRDSPSPHDLPLNVGTSKMHDILEDAQGLEIHDWFRFVADKMGGQGQLLALCVRMMNQAGAFADQGRELISAIRSRTV